MSVTSTKFSKPPHVYRQFVNLFGVNDEVDTATIPEAVWAFGGLIDWPSAEASASIVSTSAADDAAGVGATSLLVEGVDEQFNPVQEVISLAGLTPVVTTQPFLWINDLTVIAHGGGSTRTNVGVITATIGGKNVARIRASEGQARQLVYTVPRPIVPGQGPFILTASVTFGKQAAAFGLVSALVQTQVDGIDSGAVIRVGEVYVNTQGTSAFDIPFAAVQPLEVGTRIWFEVIEVSANNVAATGSLQLGWQ